MDNQETRKLKKITKLQFGNKKTEELNKLELEKSNLIVRIILLYSYDSRKKFRLIFCLYSNRKPKIFLIFITKLLVINKSYLIPFKLYILLFFATQNNVQTYVHDRIKILKFIATLQHCLQLNRLSKDLHFYLQKNGKTSLFGYKTLCKF